VTFKTENAATLDGIKNLSFVHKIEKAVLLKTTLHNNSEINQNYATADSSAYGLSYRQIRIHNGDYLHQNELRGQNMQIAVIDAGFFGYKTTTGFQHIFLDNRIKGVKDFVAHDGEVNSDHSHGMQVFSIIGGEIENRFMGTAPKAEFLLLRSEDATTDIYGFQSEYLVEEDNWIAAAEYADSLGTDIINTSLGYTTFNFPEQNHSYEDMNGSATRISKAAEIAAKKGMIVVVSAGNEGAGPWRYINAPADAKNILAVGAVNTSLIRSSFSSIGPTADNRIKPDVMSIGQGTIFLSPNNTIASGNGTSYAAPVIAGLTACLWQGARDKTNYEIMDAIRQSSDKSANPNNTYGYGIPDFKKALLRLNPVIENNEGLIAYPNPFVSKLTLIHKACKKNTLTIEIYNTSGKKIYHRSFPIVPDVPGEIEINDIGALPGGIIFIKAISGDKVMNVTAIKL
jgi:subtilisin family serine protease